MMKIKSSYKIYWSLILVLAISASISVYLPQGDILPMQELPTSKLNLAIINFFIMITIYGGLGFIGLKLSKKIGFADIWDKNIALKKKIIQPLFIGIGLGAFFIILDLILSNFHSLGALPHPPFPLSLFASITAGIGEEIIARLFFISFWVWLFSHIFFKKKYVKQTFWIVTIFSAILFTVMHIPSIFAVFNLESISDMPRILLIELFLLNGTLSIFAAYSFKKYGILTAIGIHFWADVVWHVIYGI
ncbi:CPBP family intramembrane metalloprotease [Candidatus Peregrinibacteria bacterium]|nr:CPBP family intramembrane metalloprotease [Candidatus Peregrinibacteria bacterium]